MSWPIVATRTGLALLILILATVRAAAADSGSAAMVRDIVAGEIAPVATDRDPGGVALAVYAAGRVQFLNYGSADRAQGRPVTPDTLFNLASLRKVIEATLVALGTLRGELSLDDPVSKYVGELNGDYIRTVTIGELATHTSGLLLPSDHPPWPDTAYPLAGFFDAVNAWTPGAGEAPGKQRIYTHAGYVLLQLALERRYSLPIGTLIEQRILKPLGMTSTLIPERGPGNRAVIPAQMMPRVVQGYSEHGLAIGVPGNQQGYFDFPGTGQMYSSARDLAIFVAACLDGETIDPQLREALRMTQREMFRVNEKFGQAMAWENIDADGVAIVDKPGGLNNASAYLGMVPARKMAVVLLANRGEFPHEILRNRVLPLLARLDPVCAHDCN
ncbi:serine hydrolase [Bradyrhizobium sp.]|uniref:serine hydrolase n=1 Tax=Bradyrhizobium sp. TaxID=376 RepID=UPI00403811C1